MASRLASILAALAVWALLPAPAHAQPSEAAVKAAFLPKFARYMELPEAARPPAGQPFYLCIIGRDPIGPLIDRAAASETIDGHGVAVRRFANADAAAVAGCHLAYVAGHNDAGTQAMLAKLQRQTVLTITDGRFGRARGIVHFAVVEGRVRFHIDDAAAARHGIGLSSRLLALAVEVRQR